MAAVRSLACFILVFGVNLGFADPVRPADRARALLDSQLAAINDDTAFKATFDKDAVVLGYNRHDALAGLRIETVFVGGSPHFTLKGTKLTSFVAGGNDAVVWFTAEVAVTIQGQEPGDSWHHETRAMRVTEVAIGDVGWKAVAAVIDQPHGALQESYAEAVPILSPTTAGPLAALLGSPSKLGAALGKDANVFVLGSDANERAIGGPAATNLVKRWSKLVVSVDGKVREVTAKRWGFAQANVRYVARNKTYRMRGLLVALPMSDGKWDVVAVHYVQDP